MRFCQTITALKDLTTRDLQLNGNAYLEKLVSEFLKLEAAFDRLMKEPAEADQVGWRPLAAAVLRRGEAQHLLEIAFLELERGIDPQFGDARHFLEAQAD